MPTRKIVLVVDDDPGMLKCVQRLLRQHAYEPILFSSARAFKSHTDFESAACVILDINLQDGSGIELRQGLQADGVSVPVIYITGNDNLTVREAALASGCIAFLSKPFSVHELIEPLNSVAGHCRRRPLNPPPTTEKSLSIADFVCQQVPLDQFGHRCRNKYR